MWRHSRHIHCLRCQSLGKLCCVEAKEPYSNSSCQSLGQLRGWDPLFYFKFLQGNSLLVAMLSSPSTAFMLRQERVIKAVEKSKVCEKNRVVGSPTWTVKTPCFGRKFLGKSFQASILGSIIFSHNHLWPVSQPPWQERRFSEGLIWWGWGLTGHDYRTYEMRGRSCVSTKMSDDS